MLYLAIALWPLGEVERAMSLVESAQARLAAITHVGTLAFGQHHSALFELMRGDRVRAALSAFLLARLAREHDLKLWRAFGVFLEGWAKSRERRPGRRARGHASRRRSPARTEQSVFRRAAEDCAGRGRGPGGRSPTAPSPSSTKRWRRPTAPVIARSKRNCIGRAAKSCCKRDPANPAPAEEAFLTAIAVAKQQGTRSFELRAALSLAKLYQSTARPAEAHAVLAPALEGFSPTPEMPEIAEAQALLVAIEAGAHVRHE